jgi:hypothetical protein
MLIHPWKTFHGKKKKSTLTLRIAFKVRVGKKNLILLRGKKTYLICKLKCVNHKHKWRYRCPPLEIAPNPLLTALHLGSNDQILSYSTTCPRALKPPSRKGLGSQKAQWFLQRDCDIDSQLGQPLQLLGWSVHLEPEIWESLGKPLVTGHYGCQSRGSQWHVRCSENWNHLAVQHLSGVAFSHWSYPNPLPLQNCRFYVVERILVLLNKMQIWKSVTVKQFWDFKNIINDF